MHFFSDASDRRKRFGAEPLPLGKLAPPSFGFDPICPPACQRILEASLPRLVMACAPVGYGKTVFLTELHHRLRQRKVRTIWVTLDDRDRDAEDLLVLLDAAIAVVERPAFSLPGEADLRIEAMIGRLDALPGRTAVFIDNLHYCEDPRLAGLLDQLVFGAGPGLHMMLSSAHAPPVDVTRAKLQYAVSEVDARQLCFDHERAALLFARAGVGAVTTDRIDDAVHRTEGWPAALRLLQVLAIEGGGMESALARFDGDGKDIASVLTGRVLAGFSSELVEFLMEIACLREFSADLAHAVTGQARAEEWIRMLTHRNLLVFRIDGTRHWLRMHTLLRQFLLAEGERRVTVGRRQAIRRYAAEFFVLRDEAVAMEYALEASALELASELLDRLARKLPLGRDWRLRYIRWAGHLMAVGLPLSLSAHSWYAWALCFSNEHERARWATERLLERLAREETGEPSLVERAGLLRVLTSVFLDRTDDARMAANQWLAEDRSRDPFDRAMVCSAAAIAALSAHDDDAAEGFLQLALAAVSGWEGSYGQVWVGILQAIGHIDAGDSLKVEAELAALRETAVSHLGENADIVDTLDLVHARVALDLGDAPLAAQRAARGLRSATRHGIVETVVLGMGVCVSLEAQGYPLPECSGHRAQDAVALRYPARARRILDMFRLRALARSGEVEAAEQQARRAGLWLLPGRHGPLDREGMARLLAHVELLIAQDLGERALVLIDRQLRQPATRRLPRESIELQILAAQLSLREGQKRQALRHFSMAIVLASRRRLQGPFLEHRSAVAQLLDAFSDRDLSFTGVDDLRLLAELRGRHTGGARSDPIASRESLTPREHDLLVLLDSGLSNQQIADRMAVSITTVKWHCANVYEKLGVRNRAAAIKRARIQGSLLG
ncbi:MAG: hypothetical protein KIT86_03510 [Hydrogenophaga sp.]|uniref:LuxR C-terminal-related transcriptional regulator n=1 Tax=Hydrogenophaga sp. TaxID=1904254 RepID=UPI002612C616|nr:LuxR C-terminal-related transcriptional regulator [Hydrogenophaga sp.]MCW5668703.1 hypothetical protein [Hydrogenophaga sp.]